MLRSAELLGSFASESWENLFVLLGTQWELWEGSGGWTALKWFNLTAKWVGYQPQWQQYPCCYWPPYRCVSQPRLKAPLHSSEMCLCMDGRGVRINTWIRVQDNSAVGMYPLYLPGSRQCCHWFSFISESEDVHWLQVYKGSISF